MTSGAAQYPPAPSNVPPDLTTPSARYRLRVIVVLSTLLLFALLYLGLVVGSAYLCYWSFAPESAAGKTTGRNLLLGASRTDERLTRVFNDALQQRQQDRIDDNKFLQVLEHDVLPPWQAQRQRLAEVQGLSRGEQRLVEQCRESFLVQEESWRLLVSAIRNNDAWSAEQSQQKNRQAEQLVRQFAADAERYYRSHTPRKSDSHGWKVIVGIISGLLCLFLVKGFLKFRRADRAQRLEVTEKDQPALFAFIRRLCLDTRAPRPYRVYLTPEVNAAVFYHESLLSLLLPMPKNLVIGLGLVNQLNLSEFKAVLAHEFGHFSQNSMKLGNYVYMSNRVIADLVFGRDWLDGVVAALCRIDIRIAIFAWAFTGVLWALRKTLRGLFQLINFANSALSRQMEFNADLVAVSVTGSDALIHALARMDFAAEALGQAWHDLDAAADHQLYSRDLFYHQTQAAKYLRGLRNDPRLGEPPVLPEDPRQGVQVFQPEDTSVPKMWATHPTNHDREVNAKRHYIRSPIDERSPWILFQDAASVRAKVTSRVYQVARKLQEVKLEEPEVVQAFIDEEHSETTYHPRYQGVYDHRYLKPGDLDELIRSGPGELAGAEQLVATHAGLFSEEFSSRMDAHRTRQEDYQRLAPLAHGAVELTGKDFQFRGARYPAADAGKLLDQVKKELDQDFDWMARLDRQSFLVHYEMARRLGDAVRAELEERYRFHLKLQEIHDRLSTQQHHVNAALSRLAGKRELTQEEYQDILGVLCLTHQILEDGLKKAANLHLPALKNVTPGAPLRPVLMSKPLMACVFADGNSLHGKSIGQLLEEVGEVLDKAQRIHFKSLGGILALQEKVAEQWAALPGRSAGDGTSLVGPSVALEASGAAPAGPPEVEASKSSVAADIAD